MVSLNCSKNFSLISSWTKAKSGAIQVYPEFYSFPEQILNAAFSRLADLSTIVGLFPPNSRVTGTKFSAAALATSFPFIGDPVKIMWSHYLVQIAFATSSNVPHW